MKLTPTLTKLSTALLLSSGLAMSASAAEFLMLNDPSLSTGYEQRWNEAAIWQYVSGVDAGTAGIPDGDDTFIINRNTGGFPASDTDLSNEGMPTHSIAGIIGTGAPGRDIILKYTGDLTIGDLTVLASSSSFHIEEERDADLFINGIISGTGDLLISRSSGFDDGVTPDEVISIGGTAGPNTFSGTFVLRNTADGGDNNYIVADKVGAFGLASTLSIENTNPLGGNTFVRLTGNTSGGEGAIDDDATVVILDSKSIFDVDAGVNEFIGSGLLTVNGSVIGDGIYNNSESWITGDGFITVGVPEPSSLALLGLGGLMIARRRRG